MSNEDRKATCNLGVSDQELSAAIRVLEIIAGLHPKVRNNGKSLKRPREDTESAIDNMCTTQGDDELMDAYKHPSLRPLRKALADAYEVHSLFYYRGLGAEGYIKQSEEERTMKRQKAAEREQQKRYIAATKLRRGRVEKLESLKESAKEEELGKLTQFMIPDGHVNTMDDLTQTKTKLLTHQDDSVDLVKKNGETETFDSTGPSLPILRSCYVCKVRFRNLHHFYDQLCPECADFNYSKRHHSVNLVGKVAVVTGSRVKIGYQVCLKLLRAGATVIGTTRFPNSAISAYREEKDFDQWKNRLQIYGLDLRDVVGLEAFTQYLKLKFGHVGIDILINNACQTVRRPTAYYKPLVEREECLWRGRDDVHCEILHGCLEFEKIRRKLTTAQSSMLVVENNDGNTPTIMNEDKELHSETIGIHDKSLTTSIHRNSNSLENAISFEQTGISYSAAMTQLCLLPDDVGIDTSCLPPGLSDINGQQLDLRKTNSWILKMSEVSTPEIMECFFINALAPFVLNSRLKPLMITPEASIRPDRYIINVSAMEGKFYRYKTPNHPHTNMAKAALNMLTRTSSEDLARSDRIFMNSVDTGWINDENPLERASKTATTNLFQTPIDEIDAAARILDPIFTGVGMDLNGTTDGKEYGKFYKDYHETEW